MHKQTGWVPVPWEAHGHARMARAMPAIEPEVVGAIFCPPDGHVNSLRLFRALHASATARGAAYLPDNPVRDIAVLPGGGFRIATAQGTIEAARVVLAAGLGNAALAPMVGLTAPVRPQGGQLMVTGKTTPFLTQTMATLHQTDEGGVMIGDSKEEAPEDESVGPGALAAMARRTCRTFPLLGGLDVVRSWGTLRVMSPHGFPSYDESPPRRLARFPGHLPQAARALVARIMVSPGEAGRPRIELEGELSALLAAGGVVLPRGGVGSGVVVAGA